MTNIHLQHLKTLGLTVNVRILVDTVGHDFWVAEAPGACVTGHVYLEDDRHSYIFTETRKTMNEVDIVLPKGRTSTQKYESY